MHKPIARILIVFMLCGNLAWSAQLQLPDLQHDDAAPSVLVHGCGADPSDHGQAVDLTDHACDHGCHGGAHCLGLPTTCGWPSATRTRSASGLLPALYRSWASEPPCPPPNA